MQEESDFLRGQMTALYDQIEVLRAENAKLIAEREAVKSDLDMCKLCADSYEDELKKMHAEREAMMKPKHKRADELVVGDSINKNGEVIKIFQITNNGGYIKINFDESYLPPEALIEIDRPLPAQQIQYSKAFSDGFKAGKEGDEDLLAHVLMHDEPAQQIPEGWKIKTAGNAIVLTSPDDFHVAFRCCEDAHFGHPKNVIFRYFSQLSASQPKGDV